MTTTANFRNTGPRRYCPHCKQQRSTYRGRFTLHYGLDGKLCPGSEQPVPKIDNRTEPAPLADA